jgi:hypothetical protein
VIAAERGGAIIFELAFRHTRELLPLHMARSPSCRTCRAGSSATASASDTFCERIWIGRRIRHPAYAKDAPVACFHMILGSHSQEKNLWARAAATRQEKTALSFAILWLAAAADQIQVR